jgi:deazaflavin-dependent oxidoreductase (nitroreductase family)
MGTMTVTAEPHTEARDPAPARRRRPRLLLASIGLAAPGWISWAITHHGRGSAAVTSAVLVVNAVATWWFPSLKLRVVRMAQRYLINPLTRALLWTGIVPLGLALLETTGRRSGRPRRTPVGVGRVGDTFWIVAEHGCHAGYVRNIQADPAVRIRFRRGLLPRWHDGVATVVPDDDPYLRQRLLCRRRPIRAWNAAMVRAMGTDLVTVRVDLRR